MALPVGLL